jgi:hypothetical protein
MTLSLNQIYLFHILFLVKPIAFIECGKCPETKFILKNTLCECNEQTIKCNGTYSLNRIFVTITNKLHHSLRNFDKLEITECNSQELQNNLFDGIKFNYVKILKCDSVTSFDSHIFAGTSNTLQILDLELNSNKVSFWEQVFHSIVHLSELHSLHAPVIKTMILPNNAFNTLGVRRIPLKEIYFNDGYGLTIAQSFSHIY